MPHKRRKRSDREAASAALGFDNPPTAKDSLLPIASTSKDVQGDDGQQKKKRPSSAIADSDSTAIKSNNKRRKSKQANKQDGLEAGVSKNLHRILNAGNVREEYQAKKKQKLEQAQSKQGSSSKSLVPLPYESLGAFNRRVEQTLRPEIASAIRHSTQKHQKNKGNKRAKKSDANDGDGEDAEDRKEEEFAETTTKRGKVKARPTPEDSVDPHARKSTAKDSDTVGKHSKLYVPPPRRDGTARATEFEEASLRRNIRDIVEAPPMALHRPSRKSKGLIPIASAEAPVGHSRLPISGALKEQMEKERERVIAQYRALKESQKRQ
ncbi:hypothetical protein OIV83_005224 [Microbotryomycetes sp. JL201]|nr:hypothetical protein OIV83_005224 [Microbotryomycetes sp. JL201]